MDKLKLLNKISLVPGTLAIAALSITIQANAVANSNTDNQIILRGNHQVSVNQVPKPPELLKASVFDGFYLGAGPSLIATTGTAKTDFDKSPLKWTVYGQPGHEKFPLSDYGFGVGGFGGYGLTYQNLYAGSELFANYSPIKTFGIKEDTRSGDAHWYADQVKSDYTLGAALRVGYLLSQRSMIYALVGGDYTNFRVKSIDGNKGASLYGNSPSVTKHVLGFMPGIGMETMFNENWALRGQYTYSLYSKFTDTYKGTTQEGDPIINAKTKYDLNRGTFNLAVAYHFNPSDTQQNSMLPLFNNPNESLSGFYLGLGPELTAVTGTVKDGWVNDYKADSSTKISSCYPGVTAVGGYGVNVGPNWHVGGELFADYSPMKSKITYLGGHIYEYWHQTKSDFSYGAALRGGYLFSPKSMIYALVGADITRFKVRMYDGNWEESTIYTAPWKTRNMIGFMPGIGFESMINQNLSARVQYTYSIYPSLKENFSFVRFVAEDLSSKYEPARSRITALFSYHFNPM